MTDGGSRSVTAAYFSSKEQRVTHAKQRPPILINVTFTYSSSERLLADKGHCRDV